MREGTAFLGARAFLFLLLFFLWVGELGGEELDEWIAGGLTIGGIKLLLATALLRVANRQDETIVPKFSSLGCP